MGIRRPALDSCHAALLITYFTGSGLDQRGSLDPAVKRTTNWLTVWLPWFKNGANEPRVRGSVPLWSSWLCTVSRSWAAPLFCKCSGVTRGTGQKKKNRSISSVRKSTLSSRLWSVYKSQHCYSAAAVKMATQIL